MSDPDAMLNDWIERVSQERFVASRDGKERRRVPDNPNQCKAHPEPAQTTPTDRLSGRILMATVLQPLPEDWWSREDRERREAEVARMNHRLPGIHVVRDDGALQAYKTALDAQERRVLLNELQPRRLPYLLPVLVVLLALGAILGAVLLETMGY